MVGAELQGGLKHKKLKRQTVSSGLFNFGNKQNSTLLFLYIIKVIIIKTIKK